MKYKKIAVLLSCFLLLAILPVRSDGAKNRFSFTPEKPLKGSEVTVKYNPSGTYLDGMDDIEMIVYQLRSKDPIALSVDLKPENDVWIGSFKLDSETASAIVIFKSGEDSDNNEGRGYRIFIYDSGGGWSAGAGAAVSNFIENLGSLMKITDNAATASTSLKIFESDFEKHPEIKFDYLNSYLRLVKRVKKNEANDIIRKELDLIAVEKDLTEEKISFLYDWYKRIDMNEKADELKNQILEKEPSGNFAARMELDKFYELKDFNKKTEFIAAFKKNFPESETLPSLYRSLIWGSLQDDNLEAAAKHLGTYGEYASWYFYTGMAEKLIKKEDYATALGYSEKAVSMIRDEMENPKEEKPSYMTDREWEKDKKETLGLALSIYGEIYFKLGKKQEALKSLLEAYTLTDGSDEKVNEVYTAALNATGSTNDAFAEIEKCIKSGAYTDEMISLQKELYTKNKGTDDGFEPYVAALKQVARDKMFEKFKRVILDYKAPSFKLKDINGKTVSLEDFRGKTVILDFWATWCNPCTMSFPTMQKAQELLAKDGSVKFLFMNTFEESKDQEKNVTEFLNEKKYPFHVLYDVDRLVAGDFGVTAIPTKFFIDKNGNVRFKSIGWDGSEKKTIEEISIMIEMIK